MYNTFFQGSLRKSVQTLLRNNTTHSVFKKYNHSPCVIALCSISAQSRSSISFRHYSDMIMSAMASHITNVTIVYSTVCSGADQRRYQSSASLAFVKGNAPVTGEVPAQRASISESVFIWWRHHESLYWHWDDRLCKPNVMNKSRFHIWLNNRHNKIKHNKTTCAFYFKHLTVMNGIISMLLKMVPVDKIWNSKRFEKGLDLTQVIHLCISNH